MDPLAGGASEDWIRSVPVHHHAWPPRLNDALQGRDVLALTFAPVSETVTDPARPPPLLVGFDGQLDQGLLGGGQEAGWAVA